VNISSEGSDIEMRNWTLAKVEVTGSLFAFLFIVFSPGTLAVTSEKIFLTGDINTEIHEPQAVVNRAASLLGWRGIPEHFTRENPVRTGKEFDINKIFTVLKHLSIGEGYTLGYAYRFDFKWGAPVLYARKKGEPRYRTFSEYEEAVRAGDETVRGSYLDRVWTDGTPEDFFEFVVLRIMGRQFYLFWHSNYYDHLIICNPAKLEEVLSMPDPPISSDVKDKARNLELTPTVEFEENLVTVTLIVFSKWGGFTRQRNFLTRS